MVDWMIEVLTNFKCEDQTFFLAISLLDRYLKNNVSPQEVADLHLMGVTCMFIAPLIFTFDGSTAQYFPPP